MKIIKYLHTGILVSDLEKAISFYSDVLGLTRVDRNLKYPGAWYQLDTYQIHLIVDPHLNLQLQNIEKWGRNPHLAFGVHNLEATKTALESAGYSIQMSASGRKSLFTQDPDGNMIEISEV